jgi:hypothetical protein
MHASHTEARVARWFVFEPKIPILVKFGGPWNRKCCYILRLFGLFYGIFVYLSCGLVCGNLVYFFHFGMFGPRKNLATVKRTTINAAVQCDVGNLRR